MKTEENKPGYTLQEMTLYFLQLGAKGFGGPVALVEYMHRDLVERREWISEEEYKQGIALAQLAPGPLATQLCIYLGFVHYRIVGGTLVGLAFVLPSFIMVVLLGMAYKIFNGLPWMQAVFYGVGAAVIGIISISCYRLALRTIGPFNRIAFKDRYLLWLIFLVAVIVTAITENENVLLFVGAGLLYMLIKTPRGSVKKGMCFGLTLLQINFWSSDTATLQTIGVYFMKAGAFVFGSGLAIVPFLHSGVVTEHHWLTEQQFLDAVAVAMITPGPVVITVGFIGYLVAGFPGAVVASTATFLPCYLLTIIPAPYFKKISGNVYIKAFVDGITAAVVGALAGAVIVIAGRGISDIPTAAIAVASILLMTRWKRLQEPYIILSAALIGLAIRFFF